MHRYTPPGGRDPHQLALARGAAVARLGRQLSAAGVLQPELVIAHSAWGEALQLREVWPQARLVVYPELWGTPACLGHGFEADLGAISAAQWAGMQRQNLITAISLGQADAAVAPCHFQRDSFPPGLRQAIRVIPDGLDGERLRPDPSQSLLLPSGLRLRAGDPVITFASRQLEPLRGLDRFLAALPAVLAAEPTVQVLIAGDCGPGYGPQASSPGSFLAEALRRLPASVDRRRLHLLGRLSYGRFVAMLQISAAHVYLTYPYTLSWSLLEALACGAPVVSNRPDPLERGPVDEVIRDGRQGLLVPFHDADALAAALLRLIREPQLGRQLGRAGRRQVLEQFGLAAAAAGYGALFAELGLPSPGGTRLA